MRRYASLKRGPKRIRDLLSAVLYFNKKRSDREHNVDEDVRQVIAKDRTYSANPYGVYTGMWGIYKTPPLTDWDCTALVDTANFPDNTRISWRVTVPPGGDGIWGFPQIFYGNYDNGPGVIVPRQIYTISDLTISHSGWVFSGSDPASTLYEYWVSTTAHASGAITDKVAEVGYWPKSSGSSIPYANGSTSLGTFNDKNGVTWQVRQNVAASGEPYYFAHRPDYSSYDGDIDCASLNKFLIERGKLTGKEYFNGLACGPEPQGGEGYIEFSNFSVSYAGAARVPMTIVNLTATGLSSTTIRLDYAAAGGADSHQYRMNGGVWTNMPSDRIITGLTASTSYNFEVRGVNATGNGLASNTATGSTTSGAVNKINEPWTTQNDWTYTAGVAYTGGVVNVNTTPYNDIKKTYAGIFTPGKTYRMRCTQVITSGGYRIGIRNAAGDHNWCPLEVNATGSYDSTVVCPTNGDTIVIQFRDSGMVGTLDNLIVDELP